MTSDRLRLFAASAFAALLAAGLVARAGQQEEVVVETHKVAGAVSYLTGRGGNVGVQIGSDGVLLIDSQFAELAPKLEAAAKKLGGERLTYLLNTHWHKDHTGGNAYFGKSLTLVAHQNVRGRLADEASAGAEDGAASPALPRITYDGALSLYWNGEEIRVLHLGPGHTDGDSVVWFTGSNVVHMGDLFFNSGYPFVDTSSGGDVGGVIESCHHMLDLLPDDARVIPGHGEATDVAGLRTYVAMIEDTLARVRKELSAGRTAAQMVEADLFKDLNARWGGGFISPQRWIETLVAYAQR